MDVTREAAASFRTSAVRPAPHLLVAEAIRDVLSRRRLIRYLVQADLKKQGADTVLGNLWWVIDPLLTMLVYVILITVITPSSSRPADYPLFIFAAILPWKWFTSTIQDAVASVTGQERLIKQVHFPKIVLPTAATMAGVVHFAFGMLPLAVLILGFYRSALSWTLLLIPVIAAVQLVFSLAVAYIVSALNVFFRDVSNVSMHALRLWFYVSPALYSISQAKEITRHQPILGHIMSANPFAALLTSYRDVIYNRTPPEWSGLAIVLGSSIVLLAFATYLFKRVEPSFAKVL